MEMKFYRCKHCGQIVAIVKKTGAPLVCCGEEMEEIIPGTVEASREKHIPVVKVEKDLVTVCVGEVEHPMIEAHYIEWIAIQTNYGNQRKALKPNDKPCVCFKLLEGEEVLASYAYCNLHGLWKC